MAADPLRPVSALEMLAEIDREMKFRHWVYPKQIERGKMTMNEARRKLHVLSAIRDVVAEQIAEQRQMFGGAA